MSIKQSERTDQFLSSLVTELFDSEEEIKLTAELIKEGTLIEYCLTMKTERRRETGN